jgi:hypothetical protein
MELLDAGLVATLSVMGKSIASAWPWDWRLSARRSASD